MSFMVSVKHQSLFARHPGEGRDPAFGLVPAVAGMTGKAKIIQHISGTPY
jgi:hypothetical protein